MYGMYGVCAGMFRGVLQGDGSGEILYSACGKRRKCKAGSLRTVRQMCEGLRGGRHQAERKGRLYDRQEALYRLRQVCGGLSVPRTGEGGGFPGKQQMYRLRNLRESLSDGRAGSGGEIIRSAEKHLKFIKSSPGRKEPCRGFLYGEKGYGAGVSGK